MGYKILGKRYCRIGFRTYGGVRGQRPYGLLLHDWHIRFFEKTIIQKLLFIVRGGRSPPPAGSR